MRKRVCSLLAAALLAGCAQAVQPPAPTSTAGPPPVPTAGSAEPLYQFDLRHFVEDFSRLMTEEQLLSAIPGSRRVEGVDEFQNKLLVSEGWEYHGMKGIVLVTYDDSGVWPSPEEPMWETDFCLVSIEFCSLGVDMDRFFEIYAAVREDFASPGLADLVTDEYMDILDIYLKDTEKNLPFEEVGEQMPPDAVLGCGPSYLAGEQEGTSFTLFYWGSEITREKWEEISLRQGAPEIPGGNAAVPEICLKVGYPWGYV